MSLKAASTTIDVTPSIGSPLAGYGDRGPSTGIIDAIEAGVLMLEDGSVRALLVTLDAVGVAVSVANRLRTRCGAAWGTPADAVLLSCTHNHSGPEWFDMDEDQVIDADRMIESIAAGVRSLAAFLVPVGVELARAEVDVAENRREPGPDGAAVMGTDPNGIVDRRATTIILRGERGVVATVTVAALHGNCLKGDNTCLSSDFVGAFRRTMRDETSASAIFVQGCAGNLNPRLRGGAAEARATGERLAAEVVASLAPGRRVDGPLAVASRRMDLPMRRVPVGADAERMAHIAEEQWGRDVSRWRRWRKANEGQTLLLPATLTVIRIGGVAIGGVPWELFCEIGLEASRRFGDAALLVGYVNGYYGYLATAEEHGRGGYEIDWMPIVYGVNMGMGMPMADGSSELIIEAFGGVLASLPE